MDEYTCDEQKVDRPSTSAAPLTWISSALPSPIKIVFLLLSPKILSFLMLCSFFSYKYKLYRYNGSNYIFKQLTINMLLTNNKLLHSCTHFTHFHTRKSHTHSYEVNSRKTLPYRDKLPNTPLSNIAYNYLVIPTRYEYTQISHILITEIIFSKPVYFLHTVHTFKTFNCCATSNSFYNLLVFFYLFINNG